MIGITPTMNIKKGCILSKLGGKLSLESEPGKGTVISIKIPVDEE